MKKLLLAFLVLLLSIPLYGQECIINPANNYKGNITVCNECASCPELLGLEIETSTNVDSILFNTNLNVIGLLEIIPSNSNVFMIPAGDTLTIDGDLIFTGNASPKDFVVDGVLVVNGRLDFGSQQIEIDGTGTIKADTLSGADKTACGTIATCPTFEVETCEGTGLCEEDALPVELLYFNAKVQKESVILTWETSMEINNDYFTIEKSEDLEYWKTVTYINPRKDGKYKFQDEISEDRYYRLSQTDIDGTHENLDIQVISLNHKMIQGFQMDSDEEILSTKVYNLNGTIVEPDTKGLVVIFIQTNKNIYNKKVFNK